MFYDVVAGCEGLDAAFKPYAVRDDPLPTHFRHSDVTLPARTLDRAAAAPLARH